jgi:hypothetical protein
MHFCKSLLRYNLYNLQWKPLGVAYIFLGSKLSAPDYTTLGVMIFLLVLDCVLVFANVFFLALFSDLETDNINPIGKQDEFFKETMSTRLY